MMMPSCGYRLASQNRLGSEIASVAVTPIENETTTFEIEQIMTRSLVRELVEKTAYRVLNNAEAADAVLSGVITAVSASPVTFGQQTFGSTFLITLNVRVELRERTTGRMLFKNDNYIFREQYVINTDVRNFFSEQNPAVDRMARDFAASVITTIVEGF